MSWATLSPTKGSAASVPPGDAVRGVRRKLVDRAAFVGNSYGGWMGTIS